jgi:hypothetical protein
VAPLATVMVFDQSYVSDFQWPARNSITAFCITYKHAQYKKDSESRAQRDLTGSGKSSTLTVNLKMLFNKYFSYGYE